MVKRLFRFSFKRLGIFLAGLAVCLGLLYLWQPFQIDLVQRHPPKPLTVVLPEDIGLISTANRVLVVTAHPDDEAFYLGGTLMALKYGGATVRFVVCTNGDKGFYPFMNAEAMARTRQAEMREACRRYGALAPVFLNKRDGRLHADDALVGLIEDQIKAFNPRYIICFDADYPPRVSHSDHRASGYATDRAARKCAFTGWLLHFATFGPNTAVDVEKHWPEAQEAMSAHASQYSNRLALVRSFATAAAQRAGKSFHLHLAEQFRAVKMVRGKVVIGDR